MTPATIDQEITFQSKSSFLYSFFFLPPEKRQAIYTLYAFCRQTDDIADAPSPLEKRIQQLNGWEAELKNCFSRKVSNYFDSLKQVAEQFKIPYDYFIELIEGVRMDLNQLNYRSFDELRLYCYRVASCVGLMCIQVFGYRDPQVVKYAEHLGIALQLTNIIRDVGTDLSMGRIYIPEEDLQRFHLTKDDLYSKKYTANFQAMMRFEAERAHEFYRKANAALPPQERRNMLVAEIMKNVYFKLLKKIEADNFRVLDQQIKISTSTKLLTTAKTVSKIKIFG
jgi:phytoene synthase